MPVKANPLQGLEFSGRPGTKMRATSREQAQGRPGGRRSTPSVRRRCGSPHWPAWFQAFCSSSVWGIRGRNRALAASTIPRSDRAISSLVLKVGQGLRRLRRARRSTALLLRLGNHGQEGPDSAHDARRTPSGAPGLADRKKRGQHVSYPLAKVGSSTGGGREIRNLSYSRQTPPGFFTRHGP